MLQGSTLPLRLQVLEPKAARFCLLLEHFLWRHVWQAPASTLEAKHYKEQYKGHHIIVALSGGADSSALFLALYYLRHRLGITLSAVHVHHGLRPEADEEAEAVQRFCQELGLACAVHYAPVQAYADKHGLGTEEAGRKMRYDYFSHLITQEREPSKTWIATGHQVDDLCEDVVMRFLRGAGWPALAGMVAFDAKRHLIRPMLGTTRHQIEAFLHSLGLVWIDDASNQSHVYKRNRIRHQIMPLLVEENPALRDTVLSLWQLGRIDEDFWQKRLTEAWQRLSHGKTLLEDIAPEENGQIFPHKTLCSFSQAERLRLYKMALDRLGPSQASVSQLLALDKAWQSGRGGLAFQFSGHKIASISRGAISFARIISYE